MKYAWKKYDTNETKGDNWLRKSRNKDKDTQLAKTMMPHNIDGKKETSKVMSRVESVWCKSELYIMEGMTQLNRFHMPLSQKSYFT